MNACYGIYMDWILVLASEGLLTRRCTGIHQASLSLPERYIRLRLLQSLAFIFFHPSIETTFALQDWYCVADSSFGRLKGSINRMLRQKGRSGLLSASRHSFIA